MDKETKNEFDDLMARVKYIEVKLGVKAVNKK